MARQCLKCKPAFTAVMTSSVMSVLQTFTCNCCVQPNIYNVVGLLTCLCVNDADVPPLMSYIIA